MKIKRLYINNYKSLVDFELIEPNPFSVFVGPNAAGKSNIFEALEFLSLRSAFPSYPKMFGGVKTFWNIKNREKNITIEVDLGSSIPVKLEISPINLDSIKITFEENNWEGKLMSTELLDFTQRSKFLFISGFTRIFVKREELIKIKFDGENKLRIDAGNLEPVLHRILQDKIKREEFTEWLELLIPEFSKIEVHKSELSGEYYLRIFEKYMDEPISKNLISDGTYNILALLTAVYQSDEPQFLCIEEPENGLNPYVIRELVGFFRKLCEEKGHYIWLNTHSPTLVKELQPKELILINKVNGETKAKQLDKDLKFKSMPLDEAWLTNTLGGGLPW